MFLDKVYVCVCVCLCLCACVCMCVSVSVGVWVFGEGSVGGVFGGRGNSCRNKSVVSSALP